MNLVSLLKESMLYTSQKSTVISSNIANVNTPAFKAVELKSFQSNFFFKRDIGMESTNEKHISNKKGVKFNIFYPNDTYVKQNGNNVDLEKELTDMQRNNIKHQEVVNIYSKVISFLKIGAGSK